MHMLKFAAAALLAGYFSPSAMAACYVVYGPDHQEVYRSTVPPVDLSLLLHQTLPAVAPGGSLVFSFESRSCAQEIDKLPRSAQAAAPQSARAVRAERS